MILMPISWSQPVADRQYLEPCLERYRVEFSRALVPTLMPSPARQIEQNIWWPSAPESFSVSQTPGPMSQSLDDTKEVTELLEAKCYLDRGV